MAATIRTKVGAVSTPKSKGKSGSQPTHKKTGSITKKNASAIETQSSESKSHTSETDAAAETHGANPGAKPRAKTGAKTTRAKTTKAKTAKAKTAKAKTRAKTETVEVKLEEGTGGEGSGGETNLKTEAKVAKGEEDGSSSTRDAEVQTDEREVELHARAVMDFSVDFADRVRLALTDLRALELISREECAAALTKVKRFSLPAFGLSGGARETGAHSNRPTIVRALVTLITFLVSFQCLVDARVRQSREQRVQKKRGLLKAYFMGFVEFCALRLQRLSPGDLRVDLTLLDYFLKCGAETFVDSYLSKCLLKHATSARLWLFGVERQRRLGNYERALQIAQRGYSLTKHPNLERAVRNLAVIVTAYISIAAAAEGGFHDPDASARVEVKEQKEPLHGDQGAAPAASDHDAAPAASEMSAMDCLRGAPVATPDQTCPLPDYIPLSKLPTTTGTIWS